MAVVMLLCSVTVSAHDFEVNGIYYDFNGDEVTVTYKGDGYNVYEHEYYGDVVIPSTVTYNGETYSVTSISGYSFWRCSGLTSIEIPGSVTSIGGYAFENCTGLINVTIGGGVTSIGDFAFYRCSGLTSIIIPNSVTSIGKRAFEYCTSLTSIEILNSMTSIGYDAFISTAWYKNQPDGVIYVGKVLYQYKGEMPEGTSINIKEGTLEIAGGAFWDCTDLRSIEIPNSVTNIGDFAFRNCAYLTSITIPNSVTSIGSYAFDGCTGLTSVTIPNSVTSIGEEAFNSTAWYKNQPDGVIYVGKVLYRYKGGIPTDTSINIKEGTLEIAGCAFKNCSGLTSITIPNSVTSIGNYAFDGCTGLTSINIPNSVTSIGEEAFDGCTRLASITIGSGVTSIGDYAFVGCTRLTSITIPNSVTSIGNAAFRECRGLASVTIGDSVTNIKGGVFKGCTGLTSITIPNSVTSIGEYAFSGCTGLTSVIIGSGVKSIRSNAFYDCTKLKKVINLSNLTLSIGSSENGYVAYYANFLLNGSMEGDFIFTKSNGANKLYMYLGNDTEITLPSNYKGENYIIGSYAFDGYTSLISIAIPNSVTNIEDYAFKNCSGLKNVIIPGSLTSIPQNAFSGCNNIFRALWLGKSAPKGYKNLKASINYVPNDGYTELENMVVVPYLSSAFEVDDILYVPVNPGKRTCGIINFNNIGKNLNIDINSVNYKGVEMQVESILPYTFYKNDSIKSIYVNCSKLDGNSIVECRNIENITFGKDFKEIGNNVFSDCSKLQKIYCNATVPPTCGEGVFESVDKWSCELYVPATSMPDYQAADVWSEFFLINEIPTSIEDIKDDVPAFELTADGIQFTGAEGKCVAVYTAAGALVEKIYSYAGEEITLDKGVYIICVDNKVVKVKL